MSIQMFSHRNLLKIKKVTQNLIQPTSSGDRDTKGPASPVNVSPGRKEKEIGKNNSNEGEEHIFIRLIVDEVVNQCNLVNSNYQCGECGITYESTQEIDSHMENHHTECSMCITNVKQVEMMITQMLEKDAANNAIDEKNNNLVKKNESLAKENRRLNLALKQSIIEKNEAKKDIETQMEAMNEILKQNTLLNEEVRVKADYIKLIDEIKMQKTGDKGTKKTQEVDQTQDQDDGENEDEEVEMINHTEENYADKVKKSGEKHKCKECEYETNVKVHLKGHNIAHHKGQYQCLRGCKIAFKTVGSLDEHLKIKHSTAPRFTGYTCIQCDITFNEQFQLRQHMVKKHSSRSEPKQINCEYCGIEVSSISHMNDHKQECHTGFQPVRPQVCRYFLNGACLKGEMCRFVHPENFNSQPRVPLCRNGLRCRYFARGVCSFFHKGVGVQMAKTENHSRSQEPSHPYHQQRWCKFLEDCNRVPNCGFIHAEEDFPKLAQTSKPPIHKSAPGWWEDY